MTKESLTQGFCKLTSVDVITDQHELFKKTSKLRKFSQQKLVNRSMYLYNKDEEFRKIVENCTDLKISGSQF